MLFKLFDLEDMNFIFLLGSLLVSVIAGYPLATLLRKIVASDGQLKNFWFTTASVTLGTGLWFQCILTTMAISNIALNDFNPAGLGIALLLALFVCTTAVIFTVQKDLDIRRWLLGGVILGFGFAAVQLILNISSLTVRAAYVDGLLIAAVLILGIIIGSLLQLLANRRIVKNTQSNQLERIISSASMGLLIILMNGMVNLSINEAFTQGSTQVIPNGISVELILVLMLVGAISAAIIVYRLASTNKNKQYLGKSLNSSQSWTIINMFIAVLIVVLSQWLVIKNNLVKEDLVHIGDEIQNGIWQLRLTASGSQVSDQTENKAVEKIETEVKRLISIADTIKNGGHANNKIIRPTGNTNIEKAVSKLISALRQWNKPMLANRSGNRDLSIAESLSPVSQFSDELNATIHSVANKQYQIAMYLDTLLVFILVGVFWSLYASSMKHRISSERKNSQLQEFLRELEYQQLALNKHAIVSIADDNGHIVHANKKFEDISQYSVNELIGKNHNILNSGYHPREFFNNMWKTISSGKIWHGEIKNKRKDGSCYWVDTTIVPLLGEDKKPHEYISVRTDISEVMKSQEDLRELNENLEKRVQLKVLELEDAQSALLQTEKMASIGQLAAGVAHEINNPVGYINSNLGSLKQYLDDLLKVIEVYEQSEALITDEGQKQVIQAMKQQVDLDFLRQDLKELLQESEEGVKRVKQIVQDLKDFSHVDAVEWQWADLHKGIDSTLNIVWNELKYKAKVVKEYGELPEIECIASQLNQVFMNLLVNAAHAIEEHGTITIRTGVQDDAVWVEIEDTGKGMNAETQRKIFDPFFTTKPVGKGTGLGLSLTYGIIQKHQGQIEVNSKPDKGTTFRITLPVKRVNNTKVKEKNEQNQDLSDVKMRISS